MTASSWASHVIIDGEVFYWVSRSVIAEELWLLNLKSDTIYRHLKAIANLGIIEYQKQGKKDCIKITEKGRKYLTTKLGNESEKNSDLNPTDHTYKEHHTNKDHTYKDKKEKKLIKKRAEAQNDFSLSRATSYDNLSQEYKDKLKAKCLLADGNPDRYDDFITQLEAKGYKYKNFYKAYLAWDKEKRYKNFTPPPADALGEPWVEVYRGQTTVIAVNPKTLEIKHGVLRRHTAVEEPPKAQTHHRDVSGLISSAAGKWRA